MNSSQLFFNTYLFRPFVTINCFNLFLSFVFLIPLPWIIRIKVKVLLIQSLFWSSSCFLILVDLPYYFTNVCTGIPIIQKYKFNDSFISNGWHYKLISLITYFIAAKGISRFGGNFQKIQVNVTFIWKKWSKKNPGSVNSEIIMIIGHIKKLTF